MNILKKYKYIFFNNFKYKKIKNNNNNTLLVKFFFFFFIIIIFIFICSNLKNKEKFIIKFFNKKMINSNLKNFESIKEIEINNQINDTKYENNIDFSKYSSDIKIIALYEPIYYYDKRKSEYNDKSFNIWEIVKGAKPLYKGHHQPRKPGDPTNYLQYYNLMNSEVIKKQVNLAKSHGIYGFGIYYYWINGKIIYDKPLNIYFKNKDISFPFFLILKIEKTIIKCNKIKENVLQPKVNGELVTRTISGSNAVASIK